MKNNNSIKDKFNYEMDKICSKGLRTMLLWLTFLSILLMMFFALILVILEILTQEQGAISFWESFLTSLIHILDTSALSEVQGWIYRIFLLPVTLTGIFFVSTLIGMMSTGFEARLDALRRGRSIVIEKNHTVILGWNEQIFTVIRELSIANKNLKDACIVIMGYEDKVMMEEQLREKFTDLGVTRIVCRSGSPLEPASMKILSLNFAKAIIVLSPTCEDPDSEVIKICLAITNQENRPRKPFHIVAELRDEKNLSVAQVVGGEEVEWILSKDTIGRIIAQTCRQSGLSTIYTDLMDFEGDEIYDFSHPDFVGKTYGELLNIFPNNAVMGLWKKDSEPKLNPGMSTIISYNDKLFLLAEDDDKKFFDASTPIEIKENLIQDLTNKPENPEKILILGWNSQTSKIIKELDHYVQSSSLVQVIADQSLINDTCDWQDLEIKNAEISFAYGNTSDRQVLEKLIPHNFEHIFILSYCDNLSNQAADSKTLITLLHLRDIANKCNKCRFSIVSEMLDIRNRNLAEVTKADDFVVSDRIISLYLSQVSERKLLNGVFRDFLGSEGSEVYLKPVDNYVKIGEPVNFYSVVESARRKNETAFGYRKFADSSRADRKYGILINPNKGEEQIYEEDDQIIVLADSFLGNDK